MNNQIQVGWIVETSKGVMFWPLDEYDIACIYCEDAAEPVEIYCNQSKLNQHIEAQEGEDTRMTPVPIPTNPEPIPCVTYEGETQ